MEKTAPSHGNIHSTGLNTLVIEKSDNEIPAKHELIDHCFEYRELLDSMLVEDRSHLFAVDIECQFRSGRSGIDSQYRLLLPLHALPLQLLCKIRLSTLHQVKVLLKKLGLSQDNRNALLDHRNRKYARQQRIGTDHDDICR